jgi:ResB-like family
MNDAKQSDSAAGGGSLLAVARALGSLWFASVLLMLVLVALACATIVESTSGTERALVFFYHSLWFRVLLSLLAVNVAAAVVVRFPFRKHHIGFILTHCGILVTLAGAIVTERYGVNGSMGLAEGQAADEFRLGDRDVLTVLNRGDRSETVLSLDSTAFGGLKPFDVSDGPSRDLGQVKVSVVGYLPDSEVVEEMVNDNPHPRPAVEVSTVEGENGHGHRAWIFAGRPTRMHDIGIAYRVANSTEALQKLIAESRPEVAGDEGQVKISYDGIDRVVSLSEAMKAPVRLKGPDHSYSVRVLQYLPHAVVGGENKVRNASPEPENPAIEVEVSGPDGKDVRWSFAKFPDFKSMHGESPIEDVDVVFVAPTNVRAAAPVELISGPKGDLYARFSRDGVTGEAVAVEIGSAIEIPGTQQELTVLRRFDRARMSRDVRPVEPVRKERVAAIRVRLESGKDSHLMWVQKLRSARVSVGAVPYEFLYAGEPVSLGFDVKLNTFRVGYYPGGMRPRSFQSNITITDGSLGTTQDRIVSMNHPTSYGGFTIYQSSYRIDGDKRVSFLSVSRDPGQAVLFAGYVMTFVGMIIVLVTRVRQRAVAERLLAHAVAVQSASDGEVRGRVTSNGRRVRSSELDHQGVRASEPARVGD